MSQVEQPWMPAARDIPWSTALINPRGDRHLGFDAEEGRFYRLWQYRPPEPLNAGDAIFLRPSDIDQIIRLVVMWIVGHRDDHRGFELADEVAAAAKGLVLHYAQAG